MRRMFSFPILDELKFLTKDTCRSRELLKNEYYDLPAKMGVDTADNEPSKGSRRAGHSGSARAYPFAH